MSRSWPRVMSPTPGRSTLMTSAPNQARSWVQVGPDCTCVKSRMRTPSSALLMVVFLLFFLALLVHRLGFRARCVFARVDPDVDDRRLAALGDRLAAASQRRRDLGGIAHLFAIAAQH